MKFIEYLQHTTAYQRTFPQKSLQFFLQTEKQRKTDQENDRKILSRLKQHCEDMLTKPEIGKERKVFLTDILDSLFERQQGIYVKFSSILRIKSTIKSFLREEKNQKALKEKIKEGKCIEKIEFWKTIQREFQMTIE